MHGKRNHLQGEGTICMERGTICRVRGPYAWKGEPSSEGEGTISRDRYHLRVRDHLQGEKSIFKEKEPFQSSVFPTINKMLPDCSNGNPVK
jgi:hypothetical protein